ncbi:MAG: pyrroline-5-carboxylate reductase [Planctomycetota bacterium]
MPEHAETAPPPVLPPIAVIGGGNMASAVLLGAIDAGVLDPDRLVVADRNAEKRDRFRIAVPDAASAVETAASMEQIPGDAAIMLAMKPQHFAACAAEIAPVLASVGASRLFISILAGTTSRTIASTLGGGARVARAMPNTPVRLREGITAIAPGKTATEHDMAVSRRLFAAVGEVIELDENRIEAFASVAGSGPAYVFYLAEAMLRGAAGVGFGPEVAERLVRRTLLGASRLLDTQRDESPRELRARVTSKNGMTAAATDVFDKGDVLSTVSCGIVAARDRGHELAAETERPDG